MNVKGKITEIYDTQNISNTFKKREFVLEYAENPQYPEYLKFEMIQDKCALLDGLNVGDTVDVYFNLKGRKWTDPKGVDKYFNSLQAWKFETESAGGGGSTPPAAADTGMDQMEEPGWISENEDDDLPF
ncbi:DUF3127 domain-containing protein [Fulvivirga sp. RKSG066]|uniref:DUF3127 domain-containing protein n=1 Tax=Fulvivirga aurantia TaxID=2529383 RepID=UPI0012BBD891|nr:DUF3127 domain-containing protein [Fulvivirga aurantia]MTI20642.1 DUF3127 domain-containing protein [Fulvivirga aurantia]